ncbi:hypothetical protein, partial [Escherichia coli]|uniref:hypothetical protein n=1 Tax=Escherichia coli TaxID=562 RepID=UPI001BC85835
MLFRRLERGHTLALAVPAAVGRAGVGVAARLHGWVEGHVEAPGRAPFRTDLAMVVEQLRDAKD